MRTRIKEKIVRERTSVVNERGGHEKGESTKSVERDREKEREKKRTVAYYRR